jgi:hypothetical protein
VHDFLLGCPGVNDDNGSILEVGDVSDLGSFSYGDGSIILPADDEILDLII